MKTLKLGNIIFSVEDNIIDEINYLINEFIANSILFKMENYLIKIRAMTEWNIDKLNESTRTFKHPMNGSEYWVNENSNLNIVISESFITEDTNKESTIYYKDFISLYSCLRSKISELIRNELMKESLFAIHSSFIYKEKECYLIVGIKGSGKTSSALYAYKNGYNISTDELTFVGKDMKFSYLYRYPSLSLSTINNYFPKYTYSDMKKIKSQLTLEDKYLIEMKLKDREFYLKDLKKIFIVPLGLNKDIIPDKYKKQILLDNWILGDSNEEVSDYFKLIMNKSEMININKLKALFEMNK